jgi:hypothetical protein
MQCPRCQALIPAEDVNLDNLVAKCRNCDEVFNFADQVARPVQRDNCRRGLKLPAPQPETIRVEDVNGRRQITHRWFKPPTLWLVPLGGILGLLLGLWPWDTLKRLPWDMFVLMIFCLVLHLAAIVGLTYYLLVALLNQTTVRIDGTLLTIHHGPLLWRRTRCVETGNIIQLFCEQSYNFRHQLSPKNWECEDYDLNARVTNGRKLKLLTGLDKDQALFYQEKLEEWLATKPRPVPAEVTT